ncbi:tRNA (N6-threonylcarbamoyladenosine(37)-N6)-methyltransferase TrmO [Alteromonas aestuariivivens]|uniref:tRNA (N6-threonylcarbamoyladenosine(37)-N6)-methyltransferase TrmO n=1 Tax=Alteromonas aestuariivivens TaxID=1938339 RepID=A0A3D8MFD8_9ALTE|nr:tRNA (N6-threonylcarbamoyladenosine(37)-N6)-methyltransferase TrmO [Alteromonas aestuariivivens]RDV29291.1 tRNA (N6-threonylcarbamoyladenosine(37)-N6)-methyltransferase TrmO [Alteromonas aestuariivivens]
MPDTNFAITPIGNITTPFRQKFAIPRQPNLASAKGTVRFAPQFNDANCLKGLEGYSHLWLLFVFHATVERGWKPTVKAPRLGGNATLGVFASRSTHRPNGIGMSVVRNLGHQMNRGKLELLVEGVDLLDGTPIVDIKPYIHYADALPHATDALEDYAPLPNRAVEIASTAKADLAVLARRYPDLPALLEKVLQQDPRPAYRQFDDNDDKEYRVALYDVDIAWKVQEGRILVTGFSPFPNN